MGSTERAALLTISDAAAERIKHLVETSETPVSGLRVSLSTKGCNGMSYVFEYAEEKKALDELIVHNGANIFVDPAAIMFIFGSEMDFVEDTLESRFVFNNPNESSRCGCGESFNI